MQRHLVSNVLRMVKEERCKIRETDEPPERPRRLLIKNIGQRLAEAAVNVFFPTNESGNNMSRG